jgi:putative endonuclease
LKKLIHFFEADLKILNYGMWRSSRLGVTGSVSASRRRREGRQEMECFVYILHSGKLGKYYVGQTSNVEKRLIAHNKGSNRFTSKGVPWKLIKIYTCDDRTEAIKLERKIKKRGIKRYLDEN